MLALVTLSRRTRSGAAGRRLRWGPAAVALGGCLLALSLPGCNSPDDFDRRLERDLAATVTSEGRVECQSLERDLWSCSIESDPGSGWSGAMHVKVGRDGCWTARHVRYEKGSHRTDPRSDLSFGDMQPHGRTVRGCIAPDDG